MALRILEIVVPQDVTQRAVELCSSVETLGTWHASLEEGLALVRVLVESEKLDALIHASENQFGHEPGYRIMLLSVDATLPRPVATSVTDAPAEEPSLNPERVACAELVENLSGGVRVTRTFLLTAALSTIVAVFGLARNDATIVIGAMVIAPLLTPSMALSLATTLGDGSLARRAVVAGGISMALAATIAFTLGLVLSVDVSVGEIARRSSVDLTDIVLALAAGSAGALALTSGLPGVLVGVMVAVALLPPLVVTSLMAAAGQWDAVIRAALLVTTNLICVNLAGVATFFLQNVRPQHWWEAHRARKMVRYAAGIWLALLMLLGAAIYLSDAS